MDFIYLAAAAAEATPAFNLSEFVSGGTGLSAGALLIYVIKLVVDRSVPTRTDTRESVSGALEVLQAVIEVLQKEKADDATRLADRQKKIDELRAENDEYHDRVTDLRNEIVELTNRLSEKNRNIQILVSELAKLGAIVSGITLETNTSDIKITMADSSSPSSNPASA